MSLLAFIGGTGFDLRGADSPFSSPSDSIIRTRFGPASITRAYLDAQEIVFLHRHARPTAPDIKDVPPHRVNYRANIAALKTIGVTGIFASSAVGSLRPDWKPGTLVCLDNFMDYTTNRSRTFFDERAVHIDATRPYCSDLRALLLDAASRENMELHDGGIYAGMDGPRFETGAEIRALRILGADVVGMTGTTEATLAREAEISYAGVSIVTNLAAGLLEQPLTQEEVLDAMHTTLPKLGRLFLSAARNYKDDLARPSRRTTREYATKDFEPTAEII
ncbi:S-methyl-5'-thioinosine phosphorylase [Abditibacteriota bacterium]|nr:S-methyl-5'-thioinosine phosphorylase [Abditibacteriota bacterium]